MTTTPTRPAPAAAPPDADVPRRRRRNPIPLRTRVLGLPLLAFISFLVLVPAALIVVAAFATDVPRPGNSGLAFTLENLRVLAAEGVLVAAGNSLLIAVGATVLALAIGGALAFVAARTDARARGFLYLIGLMPLFLPSYVGALAWSILASPGAGLINVAFRDLGATGPVVNVYTIVGVVVVMAMYYAPYAFLMIHSSMSLMNPDLEDAAGVHGSPTWRTIRSITLPLSLPAILGSGLLIFVLVFENFPVSQVLATPGGIDTLPTFIYKLMNSTPSRGNEAAVIAIVLVAVVLAVTWMQRRYLANRSFTTVSGKGVKARTIALGRWRTPALVVAVGYFALSIVLPLLALLLSAVRSSPYMSSFGELAEPGALDASSFATALTSDGFLGAATNSVVVSVAAAAIGTALAFVVGYVVYRTKSCGRGALENVSMVPLAIPHVVLGIGLLWTWLVMPLPVYGTLAVLIIGFVAVQMPQGFRGIAASIRATDRDLEDSAVMLGARRSRAIAVITVPLLRVSVLSTFLLLLMLSMRELTVPLFLYTSDTEILSIAIYDQFENGGALQEASATALIYCAIMFLLSYLPRRFGAGPGGHGA
ncbi:iron(III) transport system permease protein [Saccharopolyspora erythraea NRRL 2338]|uniref:AfuB homolog n=2 Tax=Saccharopolyspora erythraea TaxID=1836 RepID=A4FJS8_SACEN|nr:iron ABC transporter permease [Saccharopolyspora erythraea]EQD83361.1 AfuB [Saccharopolyspora erythraea D]PFG97946.1 iron(III) transport system permease protein [Saccharopolyspora erythraea NRRL 2338]QRK88075.1 iron ABC transporter permease [Saccharopolyspora erythraea]CAM04303.1 AfuB homolog [Saccharopolyspora erythraea NRRL 2338]